FNANANTKVTHTYLASGQYSGQLIVADNRGGSNASPFIVTIGPSNQPPAVAFTVSTNSPYVTESVIFDATATTDPEGDPMAFSWDFGDHSKTTGSFVSHAFKQIGDFIVTLTVT